MTWKIINRIFVIAFIIINIWYFYNQLINQVYDRLLIGLAIIPLLLAPLLISKILSYNISDNIRFCYYLFVFLAYTLGSILKFYQLFPGFDKVVHFISGILTSWALIMLLNKANNLSVKMPLWFQILNIITFSLAIASIWEFFEFICDNIIGGDCQHVQSTGINDTMLDMLVAFLGSIIFSTCYYLSNKSKKLIK